MVQSIDNISKQNYNAVKINIKNPQVNGLPSNDTVQSDGGNYSAVNINIDNPSVNIPEHRIYDYPEAQAPVPFDMTNVNPLPLPQGFHVAYQTTNLILPKMENELEVEAKDEDKSGKVQEDIQEDVKENVVSEAKDEAEPVAENKPKDVEEKTEVPAPNFTTVETEKGEEKEDINKVDNGENTDEVEEVKSKEIKKPEIVPAEEIKPDVDIPLVISNLTNSDFDVQAQQMEEIARVSLDDEKNAIPYIVRDVFSSLIDITKKDTAELPAPTDEQIQARKKVIANYVSIENGKANNKPVKLPYTITERDAALADSISPMEQAERNKEYALYTIAVLAKVYTDEIEKQTGNIVPMTDVPGTAAIVDSLRYNPNSGVKIASIDALRHIYRPEYKEEMSTLFALAQADTNPEVAIAATRALERINNQ